MFGILLVDKPQGITSHGVISRLRKILNTRRIGHAGTLDPLATGLLVIAVGPATRFLQYLALEPKIYEATVRFGESTNTYDAEGEISQTRPVPHDLESQIQKNIPQFLGKIAQYPPIFSAIKHQGQPLYEYARKGQDITIKPRHIFIEEFRFNSFDQQEASFSITCSGGTYIRSLAHDLGEAIGCGGHITQLRRVGAGEFHVDQSIPLDQVTAFNIIPLKNALTHLPCAHLSALQTIDIRHGRTVDYPIAETPQPVVLITPDGNVLGIARVVKTDGDTSTLQPDCVIPAEFNS
ncbi:MAG: tRNA pseudouridine(55) synthase TruB [Fimbriimonadaceae bacterium]|nr:MAG: tRNA pseudouridine(55) synthase TruB [Fimbriimonadaceae bacterium]